MEIKVENPIRIPYESESNHTLLGWDHELYTRRMRVVNAQERICIYWCSLRSPKIRVVVA